MFATKRPLWQKMSLIALIALTVSMIGCSSKGGGSGSGQVANQSTLAATYSPTPATVNVAVTIVITGGVAPYTITKLTGSGTLTGITYFSTTVETATFQIADSSGGTPIQMSIPILQSGNATQPVIPGYRVISTAGDFTFTIPAHNNIYIEVWGAGAGGQHCIISNGFPLCLYGSSGGDTTFGSLVGGGGRGVNGGSASGGSYNENGEGGNWNGSNCPGLGGGGGGPYRYLTRSGQGPGGGGDGLCAGWGANGGGGGGYAARAYVSGVMAVGSVVSGRVGAGGSAGAANGLVRISWD